MNRCLLRRTHTTKPAKRLLHHFAVSLEMNKLTREGRAVRMCVCVCVCVFIQFLHTCKFFTTYWEETLKFLPVSGLQYVGESLFIILYG